MSGVPGMTVGKLSRKRTNDERYFRDLAALTFSDLTHSSTEFVHHQFPLFSGVEATGNAIRRRTLSF